MKIMLATDGSACSLKAAQFLASHFDWFRGTPELHLFHATMPLPAGIAAVQAEQLLGSESARLYLKQEAADALLPAEDVFERQQIAYRRASSVGNVAQEIKAYAEAQGIDLIVMGSHGHGALAGLALGSVASKVLVGTQIPVLIVR